MATILADNFPGNEPIEEDEPFEEDDEQKEARRFQKHTEEVRENKKRKRETEEIEFQDKRVELQSKKIANVSVFVDLMTKLNPNWTRDDNVVKQTTDLLVNIMFNK